MNNKILKGFLLHQVMFTLFSEEYLQILTNNDRLNGIKVRFF